MANILAVDDDPAILALIQNILRKDGHAVTAITEPGKLFNLQLGRFDLILLDVMMPGIDGFMLCRIIRDRIDCPILFLTAKSMESDIMAGLNEGADDYLLKPFGAGELRARITAHLRRENRPKHSALCLGDIRFDLSAKTVTVNGRTVPFTKGEYDICEFLARNRGQVFSKEKFTRPSSVLTPPVKAAPSPSISRISARNSPRNRCCRSKRSGGLVINGAEKRKTPPQPQKTAQSFRRVYRGVLRGHNSACRFASGNLQRAVFLRRSFARKPQGIAA